MTDKKDEIVQARRIAPWSVTSVDHDPSGDGTGTIKFGDIIPMRREEAEGRTDFEVVEGKAATKDPPPEKGDEKKVE